MLPATDDLQAALRHEAALRRLAAALGAAGDADDAVQHTLVQAAAGRRPAGSPLLPFLRTVLRRYVSNVRKMAARQKRREAARAVDGSAAPADEIVAREQLRRRVADAVLALDEPYRTTVWLRWFEDLPVAAIAQRTNAPVATVRTRLLRAHAQLRARLDRVYGDRRWSVLAAPLGATTPLPAAAVIFGGLLVNKLLVGVAGALIAVGIAWWLLQPPPPIVHPPAASAPGTAQPAAAAPPVERVPRADDERTDAAPAAAVPAVVNTPVGDPTQAQLDAVAGVAEPGCIEGIVLDGSGPLGGGRAWLLAMRNGSPPWGPPADWDVATGVQRCAIDPSGRFVFTQLEPDTYAVGVTTTAGIARHVLVELHADSGTARVRFALGSARIHGRVFAPDGAPGADWHVALWGVWRMLGGTQGILTLRADASGAFTVGGLCAGDYRIEATPIPDLRDAKKQSATVFLTAGEVTAVNVGEPADACDWNGRVLLPSGAPLGVMMLVELTLTSGNRRTTCRVEGDGTFRCRTAPGEYSGSLYFATGTHVPLGKVHVPARAWLHDLVMPDGVLRVRPTFVAATSPQYPRTAVRARLRLANGASVESVQGTDSNEYFFAVPPGEHRLQCWPHPIAGAPPGGITVTMTAMPEVDVDVTLSER